MSCDGARTLSHIVLVSSDGEETVVPTAAAALSVTIREMMEDLPHLGDGERLRVPLANAPSGRALRLVVDWCTSIAASVSHTGPEAGPQDRAQDGGGCIDDLNDVDLLRDVLLLANYLNIPALLDRLCDRVAALIEDERPAEVRRVLGITSGFSDDEQHELQARYGWALPDDFEWA